MCKKDLTNDFIFVILLEKGGEIVSRQSSDSSYQTKHEIKFINHLGDHRGTTGRSGLSKKENLIRYKNILQNRSDWNNGQIDKDEVMNHIERLIQKL